MSRTVVLFASMFALCAAAQQLDQEAELRRLRNPKAGGSANGVLDHAAGRKP